jgi:4-aminobutyrate aminotransferase-like enzyme
MDVDGNVYVDLSAAFAVASVGHAHPRVVERATAQVARLPHAMGDLYPSRVKIELAARLAEITPGDLEVSILAQSGFEAVEAALKTAAVATGKATVAAFYGSYHGMGYGALSVTGYREDFRRPFRAQLGRFGVHLPYAHCYRCPLKLRHPECGLACLDLVREALDNPASGVDDVAAVILEPIQGRGGIVVPPDEWLHGLVELCRTRGVLVIFDEIFTGLGRTGRWFACEHVGVVPDLLCVGKALGGGFPLSAVIGRPEVMARWGLTPGEAVHTSTFLGNPLGCAMGLATLEVLASEGLIQAAERVGRRLRRGLEALAQTSPWVGDVRGRGCMQAVELVRDRESKTPATTLALRVVRRLLERGFIVLPSGVFGTVIALVPPFVITDAQLEAFFAAFEETLEQCGRD